MTQRNSKMRVNIWMDNRLHFMAKEAGIDFTAFFTRCLSEFFDLPPDPRQELINKKSDEVVLRLRVQYQNEMHELVRRKNEQQTLEDMEKTKENLKIVELQRFGSLLQRTSCFDRILEAIEDLDAEADVWQKAIEEVNRLNGKKYEFNAFWNASIEWHRRFVKVGGKSM